VVDRTHHGHGCLQLARDHHFTVDEKVPMNRSLSTVAVCVTQVKPGWPKNFAACPDGLVADFTVYQVPVSSPAISVRRETLVGPR